VSTPTARESRSFCFDPFGKWFISLYAGFGAFMGFALAVCALPEVRQAGIDGDFERRAFCPAGRRTSSHAKSKEVSAGVDRSRCQARDRVGPAGRTCRGGAWLPSETLRKRIRQAEADQGLRPDRPSTAEREEIKELKRENAELRRANEILRAASLFFAGEESAGRPVWSGRFEFSTSKT
jgi:hypothetical protein